METRQISSNVTKKRRRKEDIHYLVIHDTANTDIGADALRHFYYFDSGDRKSSADFFVDDKVIMQVNDYYSGYTWHCGDGKGNCGITNANSIGIELCVNTDANRAEAILNLLETVQTLMLELDIDSAHVVRHYDASRKNCPRSMNNGDWREWFDFKERVCGNMEKFEELEKRLVRIESKMIYNYIDENMPEWARGVIQKLTDYQILQGNESGELNLTDEMLRILVILDRAGVFIME